ncbi:TPA: DNA-binding response regulator [Candidatus Falkowbacteria bacterium]|jgi:two-component system copper resistance phosphate regulon response regulator CusR|nr:MAG: Two component transcriptional regulator, winged helix family [Candidatus Falkowbacteria bacterium GW2011_GWF2_43_32]HBA36507.1 DNA-binding response regulator [Candidatus Falkowbacteria bacterium]
MKILIVDDEAAIVQFLKDGLEANMYVVETAADGERGAFLGRTGNYDLIILDYMLPKMNGAEVLKELRQEKKHVPVLMLTVKSELANKNELFTLGADDYLSKPFLFEELLLRVRALLKRPPKVEGEILKIDNLTLNTRSKVIRRGGREIYLTRREFALLEYFLLNRDKIVSRSQILDHVWDYNADPFSNSVETHLASLRRKINLNKNRNLIHTFTGRGYKLALNKLN